MADSAFAPTERFRTTTGRRVPGLLCRSAFAIECASTRAWRPRNCVAVAQCPSESDKLHSCWHHLAVLGTSGRHWELCEVGPEFEWLAQFYVVPAIESSQAIISAPSKLGRRNRLPEEVRPDLGAYRSHVGAILLCLHSDSNCIETRGIRLLEGSVSAIPNKNAASPIKRLRSPPTM